MTQARSTFVLGESEFTPERFTIREQHRRLTAEDKLNIQIGWGQCANREGRSIVLTLRGRIIAQALAAPTEEEAYQIMSANLDATYKGRRKRPASKVVMTSSFMPPWTWADKIGGLGIDVVFALTSNRPKRAFAEQEFLNSWFAPYRQKDDEGTARDYEPRRVLIVPRLVLLSVKRRS